MELDDTDVFTMSRLGQLALNAKRVEIAKTAFDRVSIIKTFYSHHFI